MKDKTKEKIEKAVQSVSEFNLRKLGKGIAKGLHSAGDAVADFNIKTVTTSVGKVADKLGKKLPEKSVKVSKKTNHMADLALKLLALQNAGLEEEAQEVQAELKAMAVSKAGNSQSQE